jgi:N-acetyl-beta-hexosaminidase
MWTEFVSSERQMHQMVFPRASALAEAVWCEQRTSYEDFLLRLEAHRARLHALGVDAWHPPSSSTVTG